ISDLARLMLHHGFVKGDLPVAGNGEMAVAAHGKNSSGTNGHRQTSAAILSISASARSASACLRAFLSRCGGSIGAKYANVTFCGWKSCGVVSRKYAHNAPIAV